MATPAQFDTSGFDLPPPRGLTRTLLFLYGGIWAALVVLTTWTPGQFTPKVLTLEGPAGPVTVGLVEALGLHPPMGGTPGGPGFHLFQLVTSHFVHQPRDYLGVFFTLLGIYFFARPVEERIGRRGLRDLWIASAVGAALGACLFGVIQRPATYHVGVAPGVLALLVVFCMMIPHAVIRLFFVLPIQARFLGIGTAVMTILAAFALPDVVGGWEVGGLAGGWLWFRWGRRGGRESDDERARRIVDRIQKFQVIEGGRSGPTWH